MRLLGCIRLFLVIRCILDPVLSFITDFQVISTVRTVDHKFIFQLRRGFLELFGQGRKVGDHQRGTFKQSYSSSSADQNSIIDRATRSQTVTTIASSNPSTKDKTKKSASFGGLEVDRKIDRF